MSFDDKLYKFAEESNHIEGILTPRRHLNHAAALHKFLAYPRIGVDQLAEFVKSAQPDARLRTGPLDRVWIGGREAPTYDLVHYVLPELLNGVYRNVLTPLEAHRAYEYIHPFTDGNGRSGRALWLWQMVKFNDYDLKYKFLQMYYYQTLDEYASKR